MIAAKSRDQYLAEVQELIARFEELEVAFRPAPGETTTMIVPVALQRNLMRFCETSLSRLQKVADFLSDEALSEVLAAGAGEGSDLGTRRDASDVKDEEWFYPRAFNHHQFP